MYGGLFGDLPSTKNASSQSKNDEGEAGIRGARDNTANESKDEGTDAAETTKRSAEGPSNSSKRQASIVSGLGTSGTSMAFVPAALRQKKRPTPSAPARKPTPPSTASSSCTPTPVVKIQSKQEQNPAVLKIHDSDSVASSLPQDTVDSSLPDLEVESDEMRRLHASVTPETAYDPHVPNDLLAYWDRQALEQERKQLEQEARDTLARQEHLRKELEKEREILQKSGTVEQIVEHRTKSTVGMGRGRGRGVSNLPAWLVQKHKDALGSQEPRTETTTNTDSPSTTMILSNLTAPGEADDELADEVRQECEEQCGPVISIQVRDANPPMQPAVQALVRFAHVEHAQQAVLVFHGRRFGDRHITAEMMKPNHSM